MRYVITILAVAVAIVPASSDCAVRRRVVAPVSRVIVTGDLVTPVTAVAPIVATTYVPIQVPTYGVSYIGGDYGEVAKLRQDIQGLRDLIAQLAGPVPNGKAMLGIAGPEGIPAPKAEASVTERAVVLVQAKCAMCHTEGKNAKGPGGKPFTMFSLDGKLQVSPKMLGAIYRGKNADNKTMPPDGKGFTDEEVSVILDGLGR